MDEKANALSGAAAQGLRWASEVNSKIGELPEGQTVVGLIEELRREVKAEIGTVHRKLDAILAKLGG